MSEYTENHQDYFCVDGFMQWGPGWQQYQDMKKFFPGGYKIHITADPNQAAEVALVALPVLRQLNVYHKIVLNSGHYALLNRCSQQGKFITVYAGPVMESFLNISKSLDEVLHENQFKPGPTPYKRLAVRSETEQVTGNSNMLFYTTNVNYEL